MFFLPPFPGLAFPVIRASRPVSWHRLLSVRHAFPSPPFFLSTFRPATTSSPGLTRPMSVPGQKRVQKRKHARPRFESSRFAVRPRLSFSDNSIIPRQERAIKVTLGYFRIPFWLTCYPESGNRHCFRLRTLAPPVPATVLTRPWPDCHPSCPAGKGCKKGSTLAHGSNPPGSPSRLTSSHIFPFLTILSYHVKNMHPESPW